MPTVSYAYQFDYISDPQRGEPFPVLLLQITSLDQYRQVTPLLK
jgi:hypothetical protein